MEWGRGLELGLRLDYNFLYLHTPCSSANGSWYHDPDYAPSATGHLELQPRACETVYRSLSLQPAHSRLSKDNCKLLFQTHFLSFSSISIVSCVLKAFSLNATLNFTFNNNNNDNEDDDHDKDNDKRQ